MKLELKFIGYWSVVKISFIVNLILGFITGFFFAMIVGFFFSVISSLGEFGGMPMFQGELPPVGILFIIYPFMFGFGGAFFGTIMCIIGTFIYNVAARLLGGFELEFSEQKIEQMAPAQGQYYGPKVPDPEVKPEISPPPPPPPPPPVQPLPDDIKPPVEDDQKKDDGGQGL
jgi:hypothetical protein